MADNLAPAVAQMRHSLVPGRFVTLMVYTPSLRTGRHAHRPPVSNESARLRRAYARQQLIQAEQPSTFSGGAAGWAFWRVIGDCIEERANNFLDEDLKNSHR